MATTGFAVLRGGVRPAHVSAGVLPRSKTADAAERLLLDTIDQWQPDLIAVDAPLSLPPCLTCPSNCLGPDSTRCELKAANEVWKIGGNPVTERLCELRVRHLGAGRPLPTMRIGQIAARGTALARRLRARRAERGSLGGPDLIEVYPAASMHRLGLSVVPADSAGVEAQMASRRETIDALGCSVDELDVDDPSEVVSNAHAFDALVAAFTGWLYPDGLEAPPDGFNAGSGWIWLPIAAE